MAKYTGHSSMDLPFKNCLVATENFSAPRVRAVLEYRYRMTYDLLDLKRFEAEMHKGGGEEVAARYLAGPEQVYLNKFTSAKRKKEWLGGRFAAKYAAAEVLAQDGRGVPDSGLPVIADANGRPFIAADAKEDTWPDISISHSGDLAAAMAVSRGLCGIDVQQVTDRVLKVRERFCSSAEERALRSFFRPLRFEESSALTALWAAKEALRKAAGMNFLPGFMELELINIRAASPQTVSPPWKFIFLWHHIDMHTNKSPEKYAVAVGLLADYALALTVRSATVD